ncbi:MAG: hypothetical protein HY049_11125 [Acidobacteria bacterium]|nr:hypothetical protein [Acidobacteriota bacterium]
MRHRIRIHTLLIALLALSGAMQAANANCFEFGGFAIFQCADLAFVQPPPDFDPSIYVVDANGVTSNISAVFWQIGFGNANISNGNGSSGTGNSGPSTFNGNDSGNFAIDLRDGYSATQNALIPPGATCLSSNNWANSGVDGCADNDRGAGLGNNNDDILNPYYNVYYSKQGSPGYYSLNWQQDYPMAVLVKNRHADAFAFAAVATLNRGNVGGDGTCATTPGTNPAACDFRPGFYSFKDVKNGNANPTSDPNNPKLNVIPWQATPQPTTTSDVRVDPNDPNSDHVQAFSWPAVTVFSDQSVRSTTHPNMGGGDCVGLTPPCPAVLRDPSRAPGVGVSDVISKFGGLFRFVLEVADVNDPNFVTVLQSFPTTATSLSNVTIPQSGCWRLRTIFGKRPETTVTSIANCRLGKCGDVGFEVVSLTQCNTGCVPLPGGEICNGKDDDCDGVIDNGNPDGGADCATGLLGVCADGVKTCQAGSLQCLSKVPSSPEICDGLDNDCDGSTDENPVDEGTACSTGRSGVCAAGTQHCVSPTPVCNQTTLSSPEVCDNLDNNCNGVVDDFIPTCGMGACLVNGTCTGGTVTCTPGSPTPETCNTIDDNCDGLVDNVAPDPCPTGQLGVCAAGMKQCALGAPVCVPITPSSNEICNNLDDNCDGTIDNLTSPPTCGLGNCIQTGTCNPGGVIVCTPGNPSVETCNNQDDNCDGTVDGFATACGVGGCMRAGFCNAGADSCVAGAPTAETCNNIDDNCNGVVDDFTPTCGVGACFRTGTCNAGNLSCIPRAPDVEACNGLDDDCDGVVDNISGNTPCTLFLLNPVKAQVLDCTSPTTIQPTFVWQKGNYTKFKVLISTTPTFSTGTVVTSGTKAILTNTYQVKAKPWKKICGLAVDGGPLFVRVDGIDIHLPTTNPLRKFSSPTVQAVADKTP